MLKMIPVARRALGEGHRLTLKMRLNYAQTLFADIAATLDELHEAVSTLEDATRTARQVFGGAHPLTESIERCLQNARATLRARETLSPGSA
jgi:ABC-type transporter Mla subunit MlaD